MLISYPNALVSQIKEQFAFEYLTSLSVSLQPSLDRAMGPHLLLFEITGLAKVARPIVIL